MSTTLDTYTHRTAEMEVKAAENIERTIGKCEPSTVVQPGINPRNRRKG